MTRVGLLLPNFTPADAVGNDVAGMYQALEARGHEVCIFAKCSSVHGFNIRPCKDCQRFLQDRSAVLIYHHSTGWDEALSLLEAAHCRRVLKYHNITPAAFFEGIHPDFAHSCRLGREQIPALVALDCERYLADSAYNLRELLAEGALPADCEVVPPFHRIEHLLTVEPEAEVLRRYGDDTINVLAVGRLAPNKGHWALLDAFAVYHRYYESDSRLLIVGKSDERLTIYTEPLARRVADLGLQDVVVFTGEVSESELKAYYLAADVFLHTSEHEGFCVPVVEAMALKVPVVALAWTAIPETVAGEGLLWEEADPDLLAESVHRIVSEPAAGGPGGPGMAALPGALCRDTYRGVLPPRHGRDAVPGERSPGDTAEE